MIRQSLDMQADALYITLTDEPVANTTEVDSGTLVDLDAAGRVVGIEVIRPNRPWPLDEILARFDLTASQKRELRAYFPAAPQTSVPPAHEPSLRVAVA